MKLISTGASFAGPPSLGAANPPSLGTAGSPSLGTAPTRTWSFREALFLGQAPDGGLFVPESLEPLPPSKLRAMKEMSFGERAFVVASHLLADELADEVLTADMLHQVVHEAVSFPAPLRPLESGVHVLELFHGPTCAFKDVGARFMARAMSALRPDDAGPVTVLAATSGDTGGAVAHAFYGLPGVRVVVLYPRGRVSSRQEAQFSTLGGNVTALGVQGAFDDCQRLVREAFADRALCAAHGLTSANSINIGRLLPQIFYYVHAWAEVERRMSMAGRDLVVSVPSGNFGNLTAGLMTRALGIPIARFVAATNANSVVPDYLSSGSYRPRASVATLSNAMDVGDPSNFRRIRHLFGGDLHALRKVVAGSAWTDRETRECIRELWRRRSVVVDPHTAVGLLGLRRELSDRPDGVGVVLGTAHPAKFAEVVEPLTGRPVPVPPELAQAMKRPRQSIEVEPRLAALREALSDS